MPISDSKRIVDGVLTANKTQGASEKLVFTPAALAAFLPEFRNRLKDPAAVFRDCENTCGDSAGHTTVHADQSQDLAMWHFGLMLAEYSAGLFAQKAEEGVCHAGVRSTDPATGKLKPCKRARAMYLKILARFKHDLASLITEIEKLEAAEGTWATAEDHLPQAPRQPAPRPATAPPATP